jgi:DNA polymerase-3 subunit delta'
MSKKAVNPLSVNIAQLLVCDAQQDQAETARHHLLETLHLDLVGPEHPDVHWFGTEDTKLTIEEVRTIETQLGFQPVGEITVIIILKADQASAPAQQALLKMLEEPPSYAHWLLLTDNPTQLLPTIHSRCQLLDLRSPQLELEATDSAAMADLYNQLQTASAGQAIALSDVYSDRTETLRLLTQLAHYVYRLPATQASVNHLQQILKTKQAVAANLNLKLSLGECFLALRTL